MHHWVVGQIQSAYYKCSSSQKEQMDWGKTEKIIGKIKFENSTNLMKTNPTDFRS